MRIYIGGLYKHYKGNLYKVLTVARHSETLEWMVVYEAQYGEHTVWVRPLKMFLDTIDEDKERFSYLEDGEELILC